MATKKRRKFKKLPAVLTPEQQAALSKMVSEEIANADNFAMSMSSADGPGTDLLIGIAHDAGIDPMDDLRMGKLVKDLSSLKLNSYLIVGHRAYFKTPDNKIEEAASYVFRLEQSVIAIHKKLSLGKN